MFKKLLACFAAPALLSGATTAWAANALPRGYTLEYRLADATGRIVQSGRVALSKRNPVQMSTSYVRVSYIASCSPDTVVISNEPKCQLATADIGNTLQLALADATPDMVSLTAWVNRQTLDGMQTIENEGFETQRPLSHGWSDSKTVKVRLGYSVAVPLRDEYTLTLQPSPIGE
jgi:hypothetical protein